MTLLSVTDLKLGFTTPSGYAEAISGISFHIGRGEMLALVGESGSGKSLTALSCMQLQPPSSSQSGSIKLESEELAGAPEARLRTLRGSTMGMVFQEPMTALNPLHTIGAQIAEAITIHRSLPTKRIRETVQETLGSVGLSHFQDRLDAYPHQLSGGERQRVMIAMAIINDPQLLIADEPTTAVDVTVQAKLLQLLKKLQHERNMGMLFITHDLTLVKRFADRVAIMRQGGIVEQGQVAEIFSNPKHTYTQALLNSEPKGRALPLPPSSPVLLQGERVRVHFPIRKGLLRRTSGYIKAVEDVSLQLHKGETIGIVGESGSGKTTLGFALLRLAPSKGNIVFMGEAIGTIDGKALKPFRKHMQLVFQDPFGSLNPRMNVRQIIEEGLLVHNRELSPEVRAQRVNAILNETGLSPEMAERYPHEFSGGQRQRISIARAMVLRPALVVLDEPTSALDLTLQAQMIALLKDFQAKYGTSYLFISHDLRVVRAISHRIMVLRRGEMVECGDTETVLTAPKADYTRELIASAML